MLAEVSGKASHANSDHGVSISFWRGLCCAHQLSACGPGALLCELLFVVLGGPSLLSQAMQHPVGDEAACLLFEVAVGMYFPCTSSLKSDMVPDRIRFLAHFWHDRQDSAPNHSVGQGGLVYSLYRVPLNMLALGVLLGAPGLAGFSVAP